MRLPNWRHYQVAAISYSRFQIEDPWNESEADPGGVGWVASYPHSEKPTIKIWGQASDNL